MTNIDATIIIRSSNERTEALCEKLILNQHVPRCDIFIVHKTPFVEAMKESFKIGIKQGHSWTICVDADILLRYGVIEKMIQHAEKNSRNLCEVSGVYFDKFFGSFRGGGIHLYKTSLLHKVIINIPRNGLDIRPESCTLRKMKGLGYKQILAPIIIGIHDFEQHYRDIARKFFLHSIKHTKIIGLLINYWNTTGIEDKDYQAALFGISEGLKSLCNSNNHIIDFLNIYNEANSLFGEKQGFSINSYEDIENTIKFHPKPKNEIIFFPSKKGRINKITNALISLFNKAFD